MSLAANRTIAMNALFILLLALCCCPQALFSGERISAGSVKWEKHIAFGASGSHTAYCLMARGFFRAPTCEEMPDIIAKWLRDHPKAAIVPVATFGPVTDAD